jgi:hypothetical protein
MNASTQNGWFYITHPKYPESLAYRCHCCSLFSIGQDRVWCCGVYVTPKESWWKKLPRHQSQQRARSGFALPGTAVDFSEGTSNAEAFQ